MSVPLIRVEGASNEEDALEERKAFHDVNEPPVLGACGGETELPTKDPDLFNLRIRQHSGILTQEPPKPGEEEEGKGGKPLPSGENKTKG